MENIFLISVDGKKLYKPFFKEKTPNRLYFCRDLNEAIKYNLDSSSSIYIWGNKKPKELEKYAQQNTIPIYRVEDGFHLVPSP